MLTLGRTSTLIFTSAAPFCTPTHSAGAPVSPQPRQHLLFFFFQILFYFTITVLMGVRRSKPPFFEVNGEPGWGGGLVLRLLEGVGC